jgi:hypothetical protein
MVGKISSERQHSGAATTGWHKKEQKDREREGERESQGAPDIACVEL